MEYPRDLRDWAGYRQGGVKKLFHAASGRPAKALIRTKLLDRLEDWAKKLAAGAATPRILLLVGGPGNGKTEAVEFTVSALDDAFGFVGELGAAAARVFDFANDIPRLARIAFPSGSSTEFVALSLVQDATVRGNDLSPKPPPVLLIDDLRNLLSPGNRDIYIACVNRGVLDDALVHAIESGDMDAAALLETVIKAVGIGFDVPACWPLQKYPSIGVWAMDVESLVEKVGESPSAVDQVLNVALDETRWPASGQCAAGAKCPFCTSRNLLSQSPYRESLPRILRWFEIATGKRWSFRDLFSLVSVLLSGAPSPDEKDTGEPCEWAKKIAALGAQEHGRPEALRLAAPFILASCQYHHVLFNAWPTAGLRSFRRDIAELQLSECRGLIGLYHFLAAKHDAALPATLQAQLADLCELLDPAVADPDLSVDISSNTTIKYRDVDARFSQSVGEGFRFVRKYRSLSALDQEVLALLMEADRRLGETDVVNRRPATANRLQMLVREFACRFVRRALGARTGVVRDAEILSDFQKVIDGEPSLLNDAAKQVEGLLNEKGRFVVYLNTTFGEPLPPEQRRATLSTERQKIRPISPAPLERPDPGLRFLRIGGPASQQSIPLTYELYRSVRELKGGMLPASLPRPVIALLDTTRARLGGRVVRDEEALDGAVIRLGKHREAIIRDQSNFVVATEEGDAP